MTHHNAQATWSDGIAAYSFAWLASAPTVPDAQPGSALGGIGILVAHGPAASTDADPWKREAKNLLGAGVMRIAVDPCGTKVVAATSIGLFERPAAPATEPTARD